MKLAFKLSGDLFNTKTVLSDMQGFPVSYMNSRKDWVFRVKSVGKTLC